MWCKRWYACKVDFILCIIIINIICSVPISIQLTTLLCCSHIHSLLPIAYRSTFKGNRYSCKNVILSILRIHKYIYFYLFSIASTFIFAMVPLLHIFTCVPNLRFCMRPKFGPTEIKIKYLYICKNTVHTTHIHMYRVHLNWKCVWYW